MNNLGSVILGLWVVGPKFLPAQVRQVVAAMGEGRGWRYSKETAQQFLYLS
jgi:hypothetical protein